MLTNIIKPQGGVLADLIVTPERAAELKEESRDFLIEQSLVVLAENAVIKAAFLGFSIQKPQPQTVIIELHAEHPFAAHRVQHL